MNRGSRLEVPQELTIILLNFTVSVLVNKPSNLIEYASQYFTRMWEEQKNTNIPKTSKSEDHNHNHFEDENDDSYFSDFSKYIKFYFITIHILFLNTRPKYNYILCFCLKYFTKNLQTECRLNKIKRPKAFNFFLS